MLKSIKYLGVVLLSLLLLTNCTKDDKIDTTKSPGELVFAALDGGIEKSDYDVLCDESLVIDHAYVVLNGVEYNPKTFMLDGKLYTQSIKLVPGNYEIEEFVLMTFDNVPVKATPMWDSEYAIFVNTPLGDPDMPIEFTIEEFEKNQFDIEVLCYIPADIDNFGFEWFEVTQITVLEQCFFGDICIDDIDLYGGSLYGPIIEVDEVALFKIVVIRDDVEVDEFYNSIQGDNGLEIVSPLCLEYANYDLEDNNFEFQLWIYDYDGDGFSYQYYYSWYLLNDEMIPSNNGEDVDDGVVDFVLGDCVWGQSDLQLPIVD
jgi:hypothetical protein